MKTRFCPSPTGHLHLGNLRTALFSYWWARSQGGQWLVRMEDTDQARSSSAYAQTMLDDLRWLGLDWDEGVDVGGDAGPYYQSKRQAVYADYAQRLQQQGQTYWCFCSAEALHAERQAQIRAGKPPRYAGHCRSISADQAQARLDAGEPAVLRLRVDTERAWRVVDAIRGEHVFHGHTCGDFVLMRSDGSVGFLMSNAMDDALMGVTHVIRGEDHLSNTPRQLMILDACDLPAPQYAHLALVVDAQGKPLSKRSGSWSLAQWRQKGALPEAICNTLFRLGHACASDALLDAHAMCTSFDLERVGRSASRFDEASLLHWQQQSVRALNAKAFWSWMGGQHPPAYTDAQVNHLERMLKEVIHFPCDAESVLPGWVAAQCSYDSQAQDVLRDAGSEFFQTVLTHTSDATPVDDPKGWMQSLSVHTARKGRALFAPLRAALTGRLRGPSLADVVVFQSSRGLLQARLEQALDFTKDVA